MIIFHNQISKSKPDYNKAIKRIRNLIDKQQPELVFLLAREWENQEKYFTYKDIRQGLLNGSINNSMIKAWQDSYTQFISTHLQPIWNKTMNTAAKQISNQYPLFSFDPNHSNVRSWTAKHAGELIVQLTDTQAKGINALIQMAATTGMNVDELAKAIRPTVGLYSQQMTANFNYYQSVRNNLLQTNPHMKPETAAKIAREKAIKYAEKQHRYRAMNIARTELAFAYNMGEFEGVKQAIAKGYMGYTVKKWMTAGDERVCSSCKELQNDTEDLDCEFNTKSKGDRRVPPAHPSCRCCLEYIEIAPPKHDTINIETPAKFPKTPDDKNDIPSESTSAMTFSEKYENVQRDRLRNQFVNKVEGYKKLDTQIQGRLLNDLNLLSSKHLDIILSETKKIEIIKDGASCYYRNRNILYLLEYFDSGDLIHELGHVIETKLDLYHNSLFLSILYNGLEEVSPFDIIEDDGFIIIKDGKEIEKKIRRLDMSNSKFISEYQQQIYKTDIDGDSPIDYDKYLFNPKVLGDYFSEGYREYHQNPDNLKIKDIELYNFIKEI